MEKKNRKAVFQGIGEVGGQTENAIKYRINAGDKATNAGGETVGSNFIIMVEYRHHYDEIIKYFGEQRLKDAGAIQKDIYLHDVNITSFINMINMPSG